jgi:hypothetical protein
MLCRARARLTTCVSVHRSSPLGKLEDFFMRFKLFATVRPIGDLFIDVPEGERGRCWPPCPAARLTSVCARPQRRRFKTRRSVRPMARGSHAVAISATRAQKPEGKHAFISEDEKRKRFMVPYALSAKSQ